MAISVTEILGTDSLSGSRLVLNDNFNILTSEINAMEVYFNPTAGTITNLNDLKTQSLRVGLSTILLDVNASTFGILTNVISGLMLSTETLFVPSKVVALLELSIAVIVTFLFPVESIFPSAMV